MKVVVFGNAMGLGGAQTAFRRFTDFLVSEGHETGVVGLVGPEDQLPGHGNSLFEARIENTSPSVARKLWQTVRAGGAARGYQPHFFISVGLANSASMIARMLPRRTFRVCQDFIYGRSIVDRQLVSGTRGFHALAVQAPSMAVALKSKGYDALPLSWLPCFPDPPRSGFIRKKAGSQSEIRFAYFGRLAANKGIDLLLQALASAQVTIKPKLDIWGTGNELERLKYLSVELRLHSQVNFRGRYPEGEDYARLLCGYDGLILPSTGIEGLPLILLEAMSFGVPFLTTRVGAIPDCCINNDDAVLVDPNTDSLKRGLERFVEAVSRDSFSPTRLVRYYELNFGFNVMARRWREMMAAPHEFFSQYA